MAEPIVSVAEMRSREEATWASGVTHEAVIRRAGAAVARVVMRCSEADDPILVLAGPGNNGADAVAADQHLAERDSLLVRLNEPGAWAAADGWLEEERHNPRARILDGIFGIGLNRPVVGEAARWIEAINASGIPVISVDVPSGLNADTGEPQGVAVRAAVTVTLGAVKAGLLRSTAAEYVGRLELAHDIGLVPALPVEASRPRWTLESDFAGLPPRRRDDGHKGTFGRVAVVAGSLGYHGAGVLATQGVQRARPGLITVFVDEACYVPVASQLRSAMVRPWRGETIPEGDFDAWVVGPGLASPGLSPAVRDEVVRLWRLAPGVMVVDATALRWLPVGRLERGAGARVITPHPGEAADLLGVSVSEVQADREGAVRRLAERWPGAGVLVVLKGRHTLVGGGQGSVHVHGSGNPGLAQGGTGDVLAGFLGGLLAQPTLRGQPERTARYGVWRHGVAADVLESGGGAWTTEDLVEALGWPIRREPRAGSRPFVPIAEVVG